MGVTGIKIDTKGNISEKSVMGVFIAIGHKPNTDIFDGQLDMDNGYIIINSGLNGSVTRSSIDGVFKQVMFQTKYTDKLLHLQVLDVWQH